MANEDANAAFLSYFFRLMSWFQLFQVFNPVCSRKSGGQQKAGRRIRLYAG